MSRHLLPVPVLLDVGQCAIGVEDGRRLLAVRVRLAMVIASWHIRIVSGVDSVSGAVAVQPPAFWASSGILRCTCIVRAVPARIASTALSSSARHGLLDSVGRDIMPRSEGKTYSTSRTRQI